MRINARGGFTLVEIMIVIAIVMTIMAIAGPSFLRSRVIANEGAALSNCRSINNACQLFHLNRDTYPSRLSDLIEPESNPPYIDPGLASGTKQGYRFDFNLIDQDHFTLNAEPTSTGLLKGRYFYMDESGVIHAKSGSSAGPSDEIVF